MTHPRTLIREAAVAALLDNTIAQDRVWPNRPNPVTQQANARAGRTEFPAIIVYTTSESSVVFNEAPREYRRTVEMIVECAKHIDAGTELDEQLDDFARVVERLLLNDDTLNGTCADLRMVSTSMGIVDNGQKLLGVVALTLEADYYEFMPGDDKVAGLDDLRTVAGRYSLSGEQADADQAPETIHLDMQVVRIRVLADGETIEIQCAEAIALEDGEGALDLLLGWGVEVDEAVVVPTAAEAEGNVLRLTVPTIYGGQLVRVSYDAEAGEVAGEDFALGSFTDRPAANFSEQVLPEPEIVCEHPFNGTTQLAMSNGNYTGTTTLTSGNNFGRYAYTSGYVPRDLSAGRKAFEMQVAMPELTVGGSAAQNIALYPAASLSPQIGYVRAQYSQESGGSASFWFGGTFAGGSFAGTTARLGVVFDADAGQVECYVNGEPVGTASYTPASRTFQMYSTHNGISGADIGKTMSVTFIPSAGDFMFGSEYGIGTTDLCGNDV